MTGDDNSEARALSRRGFLKIGAGTAAAATALSASDALAESASAGAGGREHPRHDPPNAAREVPTVCGVCFWKCGVRAEVGEDGTLLHLRGIPGYPTSRGRLCPRGVGGIGFSEDTDRLLRPRVRRGERGEAVFE
jgi:thiosulfate reductase/polysulfide reductase chain A